MLKWFSFIKSNLEMYILPRKLTFPVIEFHVVASDSYLLLSFF